MPPGKANSSRAGVASIFDVARRAGVSTATVSRVLNGNTSVGSDLVARVGQAVKELNYSPNRVARSLRLRHNRVWALVISDIRTGPFFADVVRGVEDVAYEAGYSMFLCNADEDGGKEAGYLQLAAAENVAGVVLTPSGPGTDLTPVLEAGIKVVLADRRLPGRQADTVITDNVLAASDAVGHLLANGYRRIACITGPLTTSTASERLLGYRAALEACAVVPDVALTRSADFREEGGLLAMRELLSARPRPDAVFVANNRMTAGALQAVEEAGLSVPGDLAVVGYDEVPWAPLLRTALSTVSQPAYEIGHESARLLLHRIGGYAGAPRTVVLPTSLNIRASSAPRSTLPGSGPGPGPGRQSRAGARRRAAR